MNTIFRETEHPIVAERAADFRGHYHSLVAWPSCFPAAKAKLDTGARGWRQQQGAGGGAAAARARTRRQGRSFQAVPGAPPPRLVPPSPQPSEGTLRLQAGD